MLPASWTCSGFNPNVTHLPIRCFASESHLGFIAPACASGGEDWLVELSLFDCKLVGSITLLYLEVKATPRGRAICHFAANRSPPILDFHAGYRTCWQKVGAMLQLSFFSRNVTDDIRGISGSIRTSESSVRQPLIDVHLVSSTDFIRARRSNTASVHHSRILQV